MMYDYNLQLQSFFQIDLLNEIVALKFAESRVRSYMHL